jgi:predicted permease
MNVLLEIGALFLLMAVGYALGKLKVIESTAIRGMSSLIIKAALPALILMSLQKPFSKELLGASLQTMLVAGLYYAGVILLSYLAVALLRVPREKAGAFVFALSFSNCGFIGFPVVTSILGDDALFLTSISNIPFNLLAFSAGILIMASGGKKQLNDVSGRTRVTFKNLINMNVIAAIVGFILFVSSITLPKFISLPLGMLGSVTTPLAMIVTGAMLARTSIRSVVGSWRLYAASVIRLAVWPLITALALKLCGITGQIYYITVIIAGMPSASNTSLIAEVYGGDADSASAIVFMTTLFSVVTIPLLAFILV